MTPIVPVILSGGSGTRLWPLSREMHPKQFIPFGDDTLFGKTVERAAAVPGSFPPLVVCNEKHRFFASAILREKGVEASILLEPVPRNTAPAIAMAAFAATGATGAPGAPGSGEKDALLLVMPSDHSIDPVSALGEAAERASCAARDGFLVCFGVPPLRAETGYGYIEKGEAVDAGVFRVARFTEKPDRETAEAFLNAGNFWWNSGIFLFRASRFLEELARFAPGMHAACASAWESRTRDHEFVRFDEAAFAKIPSGSIDYTVMEHTDKAAVAPFPHRWNDLGSWSAFYEESGKDDAGNAMVGDVIARDTTDSYLHSEHRLVAALGLSGIAVIETADAVLVMRREESQGVKEVLASIKAAGRSESDTHRTVFRPWGSYEVLAEAERFQVKRIVVGPGAALSMQYHHHRAEHWVVVRGTAKIINGGKELLLHEDESTYIPLGAVHRLENPGILPLELIEVQSGSYLGEDDIVRLEDSYGRN